MQRNTCEISNEMRKEIYKEMCKEIYKEVHRKDFHASFF